MECEIALPIKRYTTMRIGSKFQSNDLLLKLVKERLYL